MSLMEIQAFRVKEFDWTTGASILSISLSSCVDSYKKCKKDIIKSHSANTDDSLTSVNNKTKSRRYGLVANITNKLMLLVFSLMVVSQSNFICKAFTTLFTFDILFTVYQFMLSQVINRYETFAAFITQMICKMNKNVMKLVELKSIVDCNCQISIE